MTAADLRVLLELLIIRVACYTNLDDYKDVDWPTEVCARPQIGDRMQGSRGNEFWSLRVVAVEHATSRHDGQPYLRVELHR